MTQHPTSADAHKPTEERPTAAEVIVKAIAYSRPQSTVITRRILAALAAAGYRIVDTANMPADVTMNEPTEPKEHQP